MSKQVSEVQTLQGQDDDAAEGHVVGEGGLGDGGFADAVPVGQGPGDVGASDGDPVAGAHDAEVRDRGDVNEE